MLGTVRRNTVHFFVSGVVTCSLCCTITLCSEDITKIHRQEGTDCSHGVAGFTCEAISLT